MVACTSKYNGLNSILESFLPKVDTNIYQIKKYFKSNLLKKKDLNHLVTKKEQLTFERRIF